MRKPLFLSKRIRKAFINFILIAVVLTLTLTYGYTYTSSVSTCLSYISGSSTEWCRYSTTYSSGYACSTSEVSSYGGDSSYSRGSTESTYLPQNSKKLLCPSDYSNGNTQTATLNYVGSTASLYSSYLGTSNICWYKFTPYTSSIKSIIIKMSSLSYASAEVYVETSTNSFSYKGSVSNGNSLTAYIDSYEPVWVLITPSSSYAQASIYATASSQVSDSTLSTAITVVIIISSIGGCGCLACIIICIVVCIGKSLGGNKSVPIRQVNVTSQPGFADPSVQTQIYNPNIITQPQYIPNMTGQLVMQRGYPVPNQMQVYPNSGYQ